MMTPEEFFDVLNSTPSIEKRIQLLRDLEYDLYQECQIDAVMSWFYDDLETQEQADRIASIFLSKLGPIIICREASSCMKKLMTILDCAIEDCFFDGCPGATLMVKAFRKFKIKRAHECDAKILLKKFTDDPDYSLHYIVIKTLTTSTNKKRKLESNDLNTAFTKMKVSH